MTAMHNKHVFAPALAVLVCLYVACVFTRAGAAQAIANDRLQSIRQLIDDEFVKDNRGGLTFGLVENGELTWAYCLGFAEEQSRQRTAPDSIYPIASATKMLTGLMLLQLVERGQVHLSDPVEKYVPEVKHVQNPFPWSPPVTLIQLATMTAGFQSGLHIPDDIRSAVDKASTWEQKIALVIPSLKLQYEPGTTRRYSNAGYTVLGLALSRAAKRPYAEYVTDEILQPLRMNESGFVIPPARENRIVFGYPLNSADAKPERAFNSPNDILQPAAGLLTTMGDLAKLMRFQMLGGVPSVLSDTALRASYRFMVPADASLGYGDGIGFSVVRNADSHLVALGHGGAFPDGFIAAYAFDGFSRTGVILLANTYGGRAQYKLLARKILALLNPHSPGGSGLPASEEH